MITTLMRYFGWKKSVFAIGILTALLMGVCLFIVYGYIENTSRKTDLLEHARLLSQVFQIDGNLDDHEIRMIEEDPKVQNYFLVDSGGNIQRPISLRGEDFKFKDMFERISGSDENVIYDGNRIRMLSAFRDDGYLIGYLYLDLGLVDGLGVYPYLPYLAVMFLAVFLMVCCIVKIFNREIEMVEKRSSDEILRMREVFEREWRKFIHIIEEPVFIFDQECRLVEMNEKAFDRFDADLNLREGIHVFDMAKEDKLFGDIVRVIGRLNTEDGSVFNQKLEGYDPVSVIVSKSADLNFKYTVMLIGGSLC